MFHKCFALLFVACVLLLLPVQSMAVVGTCTQTSVEEIYTSGGPSPVVKTLSFTCTAGTVGDAGSYPATAINSLNTNHLKSWFLYKVETNPGAVPPDDNWDLTITNSNGIDMLGGAGMNRHTTTSQRVKPVYLDPLVGTWTINITDNTTASAVIVLDLTFVR